MEQIWKYFLTIKAEEQRVQLPPGAKILHVACQTPTQRTRAELYMWIQIDPKLELTERRMFIVRGTGEDIPPGAKYIGTGHSVTSGVPYVWHVFELAEYQLEKPIPPPTESVHMGG